jgi:hypothetical protein
MFTRWARKELQRGDLSTLSELAEGSGWGDPNPARLERLSFRGFCGGEVKRQAFRDSKRPRRPLGQAAFKIKSLRAPYDNNPVLDRRQHRCKNTPPNGASAFAPCGEMSCVARELSVHQ